MLDCLSRISTHYIFYYDSIFTTCCINLLLIIFVNKRYTIYWPTFITFITIDYNSLSMTNFTTFSHFTNFIILVSTSDNIRHSSCVCLFIIYDSNIIIIYGMIKQILKFILHHHI